MKRRVQREKGFTLIELLAVILILGIISLIAIPIVSSIINESKKGAFKSSVQNIIRAVETECQLEQIRGNTITKIYEFNNGEINNAINIKGDLPKNGTITVDESCNISLFLSDDEFCARKSINSNDILMGEMKDGICIIKDANTPPPVSFAEDDWSTIIANVRAGNIGSYNVGDTKEVTLTGEVAGTYTVRIANTSTPEECRTEGFSQTACGFVIEFESIISKQLVNSNGYNVGGWEASEIRTYVNDIIYNALPSEIKDGISNTRVVSGYGAESGETNYITNDKLYLLSMTEIWTEDINYIWLIDTAKTQTRQLDYYKNLSVTALSYSDAIKLYNGSAYGWWTRTPSTNTTGIVTIVDDTGDWFPQNCYYESGVSPAFRIE